MNEWLHVLIFASALIGAATARAEDSPCGVVTRAGRGIQIIPEKGRVLNKVELDQGVPCGTMILTHEEPLWIKLSNQTTVKLGPRAFMEIPSENGKSYKLYRGAALLSAPASLSIQTWSTPNSELDFRGGVAVLQYLPGEKASIAGCFNRKVEFRNKFNSKAIQELSAGEMSHLAIQEGRVRPAQPSVANHGSVMSVLEQIGLPREDREQIVSVVKQVYEDRSKALVSTIHDWDGSDEEPARGLASVEGNKRSAVDEKEAEFTMKQLRNRLYGTEDDQRRFVPPIFHERTPASIEQNAERASSIDDMERKKQEKIFRAETRRVEKAIERFRADDFE
jgi:hypothetical protein